MIFDNKLHAIQKTAYLLEKSNCTYFIKERFGAVRRKYNAEMLIFTAKFEKFKIRRSAERAGQQQAAPALSFLACAGAVGLGWHESNRLTITPMTAGRHKPSKHGAMWLYGAMQI